MKFLIFLFLSLFPHMVVGNFLSYLSSLVFDNEYDLVLPLEIRDVGEGLLKKYKDEKNSCLKNVLLEIQNDCTKLSSVPAELFAFKMMICVVTDVFEIAPECTDEIELENNLSLCISSIGNEKFGQLWTTYDGYLREVSVMCETIRSSLINDLVHKEISRIEHKIEANEKLYDQKFEVYLNSIHKRFTRSEVNQEIFFKLFQNITKNLDVAISSIQNQIYKEKAQIESIQNKNEKGIERILIDELKRYLRGEIHDERELMMSHYFNEIEESMTLIINKEIKESLNEVMETVNILVKFSNFLKEKSIYLISTLPLLFLLFFDNILIAILTGILFFLNCINMLEFDERFANCLIILYIGGVSFLVILKLHLNFDLESIQQNLCSTIVKYDGKILANSIKYYAISRYSFMILYFLHSFLLTITIISFLLM